MLSDVGAVMQELLRVRDVGGAVRSPKAASRPDQAAMWATRPPATRRRAPRRPASPDGPPRPRHVERNVYDAGWASTLRVPRHSSTRSDIVTKLQTLRDNPRLQRTFTHRLKDEMADLAATRSPRSLYGPMGVCGGDEEVGGGGAWGSVKKKRSSAQHWGWCGAAEVSPILSGVAGHRAL